MVEDPSVKETYLTGDIHAKFIETRDYDMLLK